MAKVPPSVINQVLLEGFPNLLRYTRNDNVDTTYAALIIGVREMIRELPPELITLNPMQHALFITALGVIDLAIVRWQSGAYNISKMPTSDRHVLIVVYESLSLCTDQGISAHTTGLEFVSQEDLRKSILTDLSSAHAALRNGEWKASTVLAGAVVEALLLWAIDQSDKETVDAAVKQIKNPSSKAPEHWHLEQFISVAKLLCLITENTVKQTELTKDFRNLIHPGRVVRESRECTIGTALAALAGAEEVAGDLRKKFMPAA